MEVKIKTDVTTEPVTLAEVKAFCRIDFDYVSDDGLLNDLISASREKLEKELNLSFAEKTLIMQWHGGITELPYAPVKSITSVKNNESTPQEVEYTSYGLDFKSVNVNSVSDCYIIYPVGWGTNSTANYNIEYIVGYDVLPKALKQALLIQIDYDYKNQGMQENDLSDLALQKALVYSRNLIIQ